MTSFALRAPVPDIFEGALREHEEAVSSVRQLRGPLALLAEQVQQTFQAGGKVLLFGNGGSAADAQHIAAEFSGRFEIERPGLPAIALTTDSSALTAIGNDYGFDFIFSRQVAALGREEDLALGISTSGSSDNVYLGLQTMLELGGKAWAFSGRGGGRLNELLGRNNLVVGSERTARIQECHSLMGHLLCALVDGVG